MPSPEVAQETLRQLRHLVLVFAGVAALLFAYTIWQSYQGRLELHQAQLAGCERSKKDRLANAEGWRAAEHARRASATTTDLEAAARYDALASGLEQRGHINCAAAFPGPALLRP